MEELTFSEYNEQLIEGSDFVSSLCSMLSYAKKLRRFELEGLKEKQSFNLSACFPIENIETLSLAGISSLEIAENSIFPKLRKLDVKNSTEIDKRILENITTIFPAAKYIQLSPTNTNVLDVYNFVHILITESCVVEIKIKLERMDSISNSVFDDKVIQVEKFFDELGVNRNETFVKVFRSNLPSKCNLL